MKDLITFLENFKKSQGFWVFVALFLVKILSFATNILLIRILSKEEFGLLAVVPAVFTVFAPFIGYGFPVALLRYGSLLKTDEEKANFSAQLFQKGFVFQGFLSLIFLATSIFFLGKYVGIFPIFASFAVRLFGLFLFSHIQSELRISKGNRSFSVFTILNTVFTFAITVGLTWIFSLKGYLIANAISPFFCLIWLKNFNLKGKFNYLKFSEVRKFAEHAAFTNILSELLFSADILIISYLMNEDAVADYRTAILIPSNVVFLAQSFLQTGYPELAAKSADRMYTKNYIIQFYKLFIPICVAIFVVSYIFRDEIIRLFFGEKYPHISAVFTLLMFGFSFSMLLRVFWGNFLAAIGKVKFNTYSTAAAVILLIILGFILVPKYGVMGMALSMTISLFACGIAGFGLYFFAKK